MADYRPDVLEIGADSVIRAGDLSEARNLLGHCKRLKADAVRAEGKLEAFIANPTVPLLGAIKP